MVIFNSEILSTTVDFNLFFFFFISWFDQATIWSCTSVVVCLLGELQQKQGRVFCQLQLFQIITANFLPQFT